MEQASMKRLVLILLLFYSATRVKCRPESENSQHPPSVTDHSEPHEHNEHHELEGDADAVAEGEHNPHAEASHDNKTHNDHHGGHHGIRLASWRWAEYNDYFIICVVVAFAAGSKLIFHETHWLSSRFPESCVLIILGVIMGHVIHYGLEDLSHHFPKFTATLFFNVLLPPIILDSAYSLYDRDFLGNLGAIIQFAVVGTLINVFAIGFGIYGLYQWDVMGKFDGDRELSILQCLIFSSLISAVDPVAVLAIFDEIGVNKSLYFLVFGESLFNDGVTVVLYNTMVALSAAGDNVTPDQYVLAFLSFFFVVGGGLFIGMVVGASSALFCKYTGHTRVVEPLVIFTSAYFSFVFSECLHWSGIIALIGCGIAQKRYAFLNISKKSLTTVKYGVKTMASLSDVVIFIFLGVVTASEDLSHHFEFIFWVVFLCFAVRFIVCYGMSAILNKIRIKKITKREQFIMAYGGLRGAVGFSLVTILNDPFKVEFQTATLWMIFITSFVCGGTIKAIVNILGIEKQETGTQKISENVNEKCIDHVMAGVETVVGRKVSNYRVLNWIIRFEDKFVKKLLVNKDAEHTFLRTLEKLSLDEHYARLYGPTMAVTQDQIQELLANHEAEKEPVQRTRSSMPDPGRKFSRKFSKYIPRKHSEPKTEYDLERDALKNAFAENTFDKLQNKKFGGSKYQDDTADEVELEMENMVRSKTQKLWNITLQAAKREQESDQNADDNDAIQTEDESVHDKIKKAYDRSKHSYK